jgi:hypothetical protein
MPVLGTRVTEHRFPAVLQQTGAEMARFFTSEPVTWTRSPPPLPSIFLMDGHLSRTRKGKKGQIRPVIRFCVSFQRHG